MTPDDLANIPHAPQWALLAGLLGKIAVFSGLGLFLLAIVLWAGLGWKDKVTKLTTGLFVAGCFCLFGSMAVLATLFVQNQFEFQYVFLHGGADVPLAYKIASVWTEQDGSFMLWGCTAAVFGVLTIWGTGVYRRWFGVAFSSFLAMICAILAYETPFNILPQVQAHGVTLLPDHGQGMTPALQNYWVIIHPPTIFTGFGSLTVLFAYGFAAMMTGNVLDWVRTLRPWLLLSTAILGLGLCMGGMWAYETQGWGGFWAWDPVENVSFVPWLFCAALIHGVIVQVTKGRWVASNLLLAGLPFLTFVYGTFLTRSGLLDKVSVHSFTSMDRNALVILRGFMFAVIAVYLGLWAFRGLALGRRVRKPETDFGLAREGFYRFGVLAISLFAGVVALGMSWPVLTALRGGQGSAIEEATYHMVIPWFFVPVVIAMAIAPFVSWRSMSGRELWVRTSSVLSLSAGLTGFAMLALTNPTYGVHLQGGETVRMPFGTNMPLVPWLAFLLFCCMLAAVGNIWRAIESSKRSSSSLGAFVAHVGFVTLMAGLILSRAFEQKASDFVQLGSPVNLLGYTVTYERMTGDILDRNNKALFEITSPDGSRFEARPGLFMIPSGDQPFMTWPHVQKYLSHDVYLSLHPPVTGPWDKPMTFTPGSSLTSDNVTVTYIAPTTEGPLGQPGAKFGAKVRVTTPDGTYDVHPTLELTDSGMAPQGAPAGNDLVLYMDRMDAASRSVEMQLMFRHPLFPVDLFYKPLTSLVWIGAGLLFLGGGMAAASRRVRRPAAASAPFGQEPARPRGLSPDPI